MITKTIYVCLCAIVLASCAAGDSRRHTTTQNYSSDPDVILQQLVKAETELENARADRIRIESVPQIIADTRAVLDNSWNWNMANERMRAATQRIETLQRRLEYLANVKILKKP